MKIGSLFSGYGGLELGVKSFLGGETVWHSEIDPGACKILAHHWPDVPNLGDITTVDWSTVPPVDVLTGGFPCFVAGTPILTRRGSVPIEGVVVGDEVWTHQNRWRQVVATMSRDAAVFQVGPVTTTADHLFYTRPQRRWWDNDVRQYRWGVGEPEWTRAIATQGSFLATPLRIEADYQEWLADPWVAGRYVADGWTNRKQVMVAVGDGKTDEFRREASMYHWTESVSGPGCTRFTLSSRAASEWLTEHFRKGAANKTIPNFVLAAPEEQRRRFLEGYLSGDGTRKGNLWVANTVSPHLASQLRLLAVGLGYTSQISLVPTAPTTVIDGRTVNQRDYWSVRICVNDGRYTRDEEGMRWSKQRHPVTPQGTATVYDLTVEEDHSFLAWGYVVHNCQDVSHAGRRAGLIRDGEGRTRSGLWGEMLRAINTLRPRLVVAENVRGLLSARADSDVEPCPWCMGDDDASPMRALGAVLADLADIGYDAAWYGLRAADVGAAHGRFRVFIFAWPAADADPSRFQGRGDSSGAAPSGRHGHPVSGVDGAGMTLLPTPRTSDTNGAGAHGSGGPDLRTVATLLPTPRATDGTKGGPNQRGSSGDLMLPSAVSLLPTPSVADVEGGRKHRSGSRSDERLLNGIAHHDRWGDYAPAIARWEAVLDRPAPPPTETSPKGSQRLSPAFVEWLMGLPAGHVTDPAIWGAGRGARNAQLKALGNGVVPQQAAAATRAFLADLAGGWA